MGVPQSVPEILEFLFTITQADGTRLEAMEMWVSRRMEKQMDSNEEVLQSVNETRNMLDTVRKRKRLVRACAKT